MKNPEVLHGLSVPLNLNVDRKWSFMGSLFAMTVTRTTFRSIIYASLVLVSHLVRGAPTLRPEKIESGEKDFTSRDAGLQGIWNELAKYNGKTHDTFRLDVRADTSDT